MRSFPPFSLASKSPRRQELLKTAGFDFQVRTKEVDESFPETMPAGEVPVYLAQKKARAFALEPAEIIVTGDTVVAIGDSILNKPEDAADAKRMLRLLSGTEHQVITGVCIRNAQKEKLFSAVTQVRFKELSDAEIDFYISAYKPYDKAGAYGIQEWIGLIAVEGIEGCYNNVVGFPVSAFYREFEAFLAQ
ncbi:MAG: septum formation protein Maf [Bacteroidetes bacterium]|nr:MAG: septum formation protein Maf [Bacteroidota bacterium]